MVESTSRMAKTSVPGIYRLPSGLFLVRIRMRPLTYWFFSVLFCAFSSGLYGCSDTPLKSHTLFAVVTRL